MTIQNDVARDTLSNLELNSVKENNSMSTSERERVTGAKPVNTLSHAHRALARDTYLDYIHTYETQQSEKEKKIYKHKLINCGGIFEVYSYNRDKQIDVEQDDKKEIIEVKDVDTGEKQEEQDNESEYHRKISTIYRTRTNLKRLINSNVGQYKEKDKFITLTFADYLERDEVIHRFKLFQKRLRRRYSDFEYISIIERGTKGTERLHLHTLFFGLPYIKANEFADLWQYGTIDIKALEDYNEVANYVLKYIEKTLTEDNYIPKGKKFYITSKNLIRPDITYLTDEELEIFISENSDKACVYETTLMNKATLENFEYRKYRKLHKKDAEWLTPNEDWTDEQMQEYDRYLEQMEQEKAKLERLGLLQEDGDDIDFEF